MSPDECLDEARRVLLEAEMQADLERMARLTAIADSWIDMARCLVEEVQS